jgi:small neutral amino acid transporter SnatA (MarC family)
MQSVNTISRPRRAAQRIAAGALMTTLFVGVTAGPALAADTSSVAAVRSAVVQIAPTATPTADAVTQLKATIDASSHNQGTDQNQGKATRIAVVWAVAATVVMATMLAGSILYRPRRRRK